MTWLQLAQQTAIVTGAASGIGAAVAKALLAERCRVVLADADAMAMKHQWEKDETTSSEQHNAIIVPCNVTDPYQVQSLIHQADDFAQSGAPDAAGASTAAASLLVNCAGITRDSWISKMNLEDWEKVVDVNLKGTFLTCRYFLDQERIQRLSSISSSSSSSLSIVNIGSIVSEHGNLGQVNYAASKGGVVGLTRALAKEMASRRRSSPSSSASSLPSVPTIRVNAVLPGFIDTPMTRAVPDPVQQSVIVPKIPMGRFGTPDEVANVVSFLLSSRSSYITGECIRVSGMMAL